MGRPTLPVRTDSTIGIFTLIRPQPTARVCAGVLPKKYPRRR